MWGIKFVSISNKNKINFLFLFSWRGKFWQLFTVSLHVEQPHWSKQSSANSQQNYDQINKNGNFKTFKIKLKANPFSFFFFTILP